MKERGGIGRTIGVAIAVIFIVLFAFVGYHLYAQGERIRLTPVIFIVTLMMLVLILSLRRPQSPGTTERAAPFNTGLSKDNLRETPRDDALHLLLTSKDCVFITALASELKKDGIEFAVLDQYAGRMMRFLPDMEMKVMVPGKHYDRSLSIAKDLVEGSASEGPDSNNVGLNNLTTGRS